MPQPVQVKPGNRTQLGLVRAIAGEQAAVVSRAQLLPDVSRGKISRALQSGRLHRIHSGIYATVAPELLTEEGHLLAALLAAGDGATWPAATASARSSSTPTRSSPTSWTPSRRP
jgi:hypothetical protein